MIKFSTRRVNGWNNRHLNMTKVVNALHLRLKNGYSLTWEEKQFLGDYESLKKQYNKSV